MEDEEDQITTQTVDDPSSLKSSSPSENENENPRKADLRWSNTLKRIVNGVVVLKVVRKIFIFLSKKSPPTKRSSFFFSNPFCSFHTHLLHLITFHPSKQTQTRAFDTESAGSCSATGFIVDRHLGILLTNRHVVTPGPIVAEAIFHNREEVPCFPLYHDPIHDFGFFRFDPGRLKFIQPEEIPLAPEAAAVGLDIRVVGNDSGEKISILSGTLARLDRDAPHYGRKSFNDFNTFYIQAASGTKGGSSGSPVVDIHGRAVALNAGGKNKAASAYYLPLARVVRALKMLRLCAVIGKSSSSSSFLWKAPCIPRGDFQATFLFKGFDEVKRLGLRPETEAAVREAQQQKNSTATATAAAAAEIEEAIQSSASCNGMLVVDSVVPGGPSDGALQPGDVLIRLNGEFISDFQSMEELLDANVDGSVAVDVERGGAAMHAVLPVQNLHSVTPAVFLELGGGSLHEMSYQQARNNRSAVGQVFVAEPGYLFGKSNISKYSIITALNGTSTPALSDFIAAVMALHHGQRVPIEFFTFDERNRRKQAILHVDWNWYGPPVLWKRDDAAGVWNSTTLWPKTALHSSSSSVDDVVDGVGASDLERGTEQNNEEEEVKVKPSLPKGSQQPTTNAPLQKTHTSPPPLPAPPSNGGANNKKVPLPRHHSVPDVPLPSEIEKTQAGVTAQAEDNRLSKTLPLSDVAVTIDQGPEAWRTRLEDRLRSAMVAVDVEIPLVGLSDGVYSRAFSGCGIIVHLSSHLGLVLVDRNTVSIGLGDVMLSIGAFPAEIPAKIRFLHPYHNFSILSFDPGDLSQAALDLMAPVDFAEEPPLKRGEAVELVGLSKSLRILHRTSLVTTPAMTVSVAPADVPRFRAVHEEVIKIDQDFGVAYSGVLTDRSGAVRALWGSYSEQVDKEDSEWTAGLATSVFRPWIDALISRLDPPSPSTTTNSTHHEIGVGLPPSVRVLDAELEPLLLSKAAQFGLPLEWISRLMALDAERRQVLRVRSTVAHSHAQKVLRDGDMVLAVAEQAVSSFGDVEKIINDYHQNDTSSSTTPEVSEEAAALPLTIFRGGHVISVSVLLGQEDGLGTDRLVQWCGAQLQAPHRGIRELGFLPEGASGVYISRWHHGSPAHRFGLYALYFIVEVNGSATPDLDTFLKVVSPLEDGADVRVTIVHYETTRRKVLTMKTDLR